MECRLCGYLNTHNMVKPPLGANGISARNASKRSIAAQRAGLTQQPWTWHDLVTYPTVSLMHYQ